MGADFISVIPARQPKFKRAETRGCTTELWRNRSWTHGWHAQAQLERVFLGHRTYPKDLGMARTVGGFGAAVPYGGIRSRRYHIVAYSGASVSVPRPFS